MWKTQQSQRIYCFCLESGQKKLKAENLSQSTIIQKHFKDFCWCSQNMLQNVIYIQHTNNKSVYMKTGHRQNGQ